MSQIPTDNDDNRSVAASDFVQIDQHVADQEEQQQEGQSQFGLHQSLDWTLETGSTRNYENGLKEQKLMVEKLEAKIETLQEKVKNLELEAKIRAMEENKEQNTKYQALETKVNELAQMLSTQNEQHRKEMEHLKDGFAKEMAELKNGFAKMLSAQSDQDQQQMEELESKNRKLEEKLMSNVEVQTTKNGALLDAKMEQLQDEFSKKLAEQQQHMVAQFQTQFHSLEQKLKEAAEQRAQMGKNQLEEIQQKMENFREEMDQNGQQASGSIQQKLDYMWSQLMVKSKILANPKGIVWDPSKSKADMSECGLKVTSTRCGWDFAIATEGYAISGENCRKENFQFPGTIVFYYEVTITSRDWHSVGFTNGSKPADLVGLSPNSYGIVGYGANKAYLWFSGKEHKLECLTKAIVGGDVIGSGLMLNSHNELAVFFTLNGILLGKPISINPTVDRLYPTVSIYCASVEANFGGNISAKPFKFDTDKWPGLVFE